MNASGLLNFVYHTTFASSLVYALLNTCYGMIWVQHICISLLQFFFHSSFLHHPCRCLYHHD